MSGVPATGIMGAALEAPHWMDVFLNNFNTSPYFIGLMMLTMNLGSRFLGLEMSKGQEAFFSHPWIRRFLIFVVFFIGTRNIWVAFWLAFTAILLLGYLFNENSSLCLFKAGLPGSSCAKLEATKLEATKLEASPLEASPQQQQSPLTPEEQSILKQLSEKMQRGQQQQQQQAPQEPKKESKIDIYGIYKTNLEAIKKLF
jgi:hypothetical protein